MPPRFQRSASIRDSQAEALPLTTFLLHWPGRSASSICFSRRLGWNLGRDPKGKRFGSGIRPTGSASPPADFHGLGRRHSRAEALRSKWPAGNSSLLQVIKMGLELKRSPLFVLANGRGGIPTEGPKGSASSPENFPSEALRIRTPQRKEALPCRKTAEGSASFLDPDPGESAFPINRSASVGKDSPASSFQRKRFGPQGR